MQLLVDRYAAALAKRLRGDTVVVIMECALGQEMKDGLMVADDGACGADALPLPLPLYGEGSASPHPPVSPTAASSSSSSRTSNSRAHLGLLSACFDWMEKNLEAAFSSRRPLQASELASLVHTALEAIIV